MAAIDRILPLPQAWGRDDVALPCAWCGAECLDDARPGILATYVEGRQFSCPDCAKLSKVAANDMLAMVTTIGVRSEADRQYMTALGITEAMVDAHHAPESRLETAAPKGT